MDTRDAAQAVDRRAVTVALNRGDVLETRRTPPTPELFRAGLQPRCTLIARQHGLASAGLQRVELLEGVSSAGVPQVALESLRTAPVLSD